MNRFVLGALATAVVCGAGMASETEWPELDRELEALSSTYQARTPGGPVFGGWIIGAWDYSGDVTTTVGGEDKDLSGVNMRAATVYASGDVGQYSYRLEFDFFGSDSGAIGLDPFADPEGTAGVLDAYGEVNVADAFKLRLGRFRQPFLQSALIDRNRTVFIDRSLLGQAFAERDEGLMAHGSFERIGWYLSMQNGTDGAADDYLFTGRVKIDILGQGAGSMGEGAYKSGDETNLMLAAAFSDDGSLEDGTAIAGEAYLSSGPFSISGEIVDLDADLGDATPWVATGTFMVTEAYEIALRWEELDDDADSRFWSAGLNWYHDDWNTKWQLQYRTGDSDDPAIEVDTISLGLAVSF